MERRRDVDERTLRERAGVWCSDAELLACGIIGFAVCAVVGLGLVALVVWLHKVMMEGGA